MICCSLILIPAFTMVILVICLIIKDLYQTRYVVKLPQNGCVRRTACKALSNQFLFDYISEHWCEKEKGEIFASNLQKKIEVVIYILCAVYNCSINNPKFLGSSEKTFYSMQWSFVFLMVRWLLSIHMKQETLWEYQSQNSMRSMAITYILVLWLCYHQSWSVL